ncbi:hypothetical protein SCLCIDRAFT_599009 [Scleroderma citrinum Foug A]|uniref:Uncharacterized protein n=1 Tax=Scleroderma citrinum Foug A TaxID=1036808 RepID=A0A0C2ZTN5_9AGAM|nr:hypothetical protein SCLCIDRAFT_599009 [Scleroderma citrinum Foug A]
MGHQCTTALHSFSPSGTIPFLCLRWVRCSGSNPHCFSISTAHRSATSTLRASLHRQALARGLCPVISELLRPRTQLRTYRLSVPCGEHHRIGFDASHGGYYLYILANVSVFRLRRRVGTPSTSYIRHQAYLAFRIALGGSASIASCCCIQGRWLISSARLTFLGAILILLRRCLGPKTPLQHFEVLPGGRAALAHI